LNIWFYIVIILIIILIYLVVKIFFMRNSIKEISISLENILKSDTNILLTVNTSDSNIKNLANTLNTELKNLRKQKLQHENGNQELKRTITNISHDIRTPLTAISGYLDLIKENQKTDKQEEYIKIIERKTNELIILTEQLFVFSKTIDIEPNIKKEKICINELLEESIANFYTILKNKNIIPKIEITEKKIYKIVDKSTITRVFENILSNACKYSSGEFEISLNKEGKIRFSNKASLLDATTVEKIFDRYYTVESAKKSTGLGLSIAKQLVELNGGTITGKFENGKLIIDIKLEE
jgi:signal transduction histidine kinase